MEAKKDYKVCAGIVTYNPDIDRLKENYLHISKQVDFVIICDNGSKNVNQIREILNKEKDCIIALDNNRGIAYALNRLCEFAKEKGYMWIMTLDQDSVCPDAMVERLSKHCNADTAIVGPRILYRGNEKYSATFNDTIENVDWVITSGSLTNTDIWEKIHGFDDKLFIDKVDTDYGVRSNRAGYKVTRDNSVILNHELGNMTCRKIFGRVIYVTNHNEMRIFYQCRNIVYLSKKLHYGNKIKDLSKIIIKILLYEGQKKAKLNKAFEGIKEGKSLLI